MLFIKPADLREIVTFPLFSDLVQCGFPSPADAPRDKCAHFREINGIAAAFQHLQKNYNPIASSFL